ncbi:MAG: glycosyltransferase, partial [Carboxylicivirga sp.]|nr:glycosyltransferase [Carboxylicivirga sp.]
MKVLQINTTVNTGSTGRIAEDIGKCLIANGHKSYIAYGNRMQPSSSHLIKVGTKRDRQWHGLKSLLFDRHGFGSDQATREMIRQIKDIKPDLVHLHNIHGYYLQVERLFSYLHQAELPVVWTFHDCWPFTGHCSYFDRYNCKRWQTVCYSCPNKHGYPKSLLLDRSRSNFHRKQKAFTKVNRMTLVAPSAWMRKHIQQSFLQRYPVEIIHNGIDLDVFKQVETSSVAVKYGLMGKKVLLGVAGRWDRRKGLDDFIKLNQILNAEYTIVLVGLDKKQIAELPANIIGLERTENVTELAALYSMAEVFVNPTYIDNFPTTNIESLACGTPVISYQTGGSPEALEDKWNCVVPQGDVNALANRIVQISEQKPLSKEDCRKRAELISDKHK